MVPLFVSLGASSVWDTTEAFYVQTPREMIESGDWILPTFNGQPRVNKPPLSYWIVAVFYRWLGVALYWERLAMALLATISLIALFSVARSLFDSTVALLATGIFATTFRFLIVSRRLMIDTLLLTMCLVAVAFWLHWLKRGRPLSFRLSCLFFGLGFLAKGPVALILPVVLLFHLWLTGRRRLGSAPWLSGLLILAIVSSSWFLVLGAFHGWEPVSDFFLSENLGRYLNQDFGPRRGVLYYLKVFPADYFPWSILFVFAAVASFRRGPWRRRDKDWNALLLLYLWVVFYIVLFSLSRNKQEYYILPAYPAASVRVALISLKTSIPDWLRWLLITLMFLAAFGLLFSSTQVLGFSRWFCLPPLLLIATGLLFLKKKILAAAATLSAFYAASFLFFSSPLETYKPIRPMAAKIEILARQLGTDRDYQAGYFRLAAPSLRFYLDRDILEIFELSEAAPAVESDRLTFLLTDAEGFGKLRRAFPGRVQLVEERERLFTNTRTILRALRSYGSGEAPSWTRPVYLVHNWPKP